MINVTIVNELNGVPQVHEIFDIDNQNKFRDLDITNITCTWFTCIT